MIFTTDFRKGLPILVERVPYIILEFTVQTPSARGAATLVRVRARNVLTSGLQDLTFKSGDRFEEPDLVKRKINFMYSEGDEFHFMDEESYEQFHLGREMLGESAKWLIEGVTLRSVVFESKVIGIELPQFIEMDVVETGPGGRSDMASGKVTKPATLSNGTVIKVPVYLGAGERVMVDTGSGEFVRRVAK